MPGRRLSAIERFALTCGLIGMVLAGGGAGLLAWGDLHPPPYGSLHREPLTGWAAFEHMALYVLGGMAAGLVMGALGGGMLALPAALVAEARGKDNTTPQPVFGLRIRWSLWIATAVVGALVWFFLLRDG